MRKDKSMFTITQAWSPGSTPLMHACMLSLTLCDPMGCSPLPVSSVHGIFQARILEWFATSSSRRSSQPRDRTHVSLRLLHWQANSSPLVPPGKPPGRWYCERKIFPAISISKKCHSHQWFLASKCVWGLPKLWSRGCCHLYWDCWGAGRTQAPAICRSLRWIRRQDLVPRQLRRIFIGINSMSPEACIFPYIEF